MSTRNQSETPCVTVLWRKLQQLEESLQKEEGVRKEVENQLAKLIEEKNNLYNDLEKKKADLSDTEDRLNKLQALKNDVDKQLAVRLMPQFFGYFSLWKVHFLETE